MYVGLVDAHTTKQYCFGKLWGQEWGEDLQLLNWLEQLQDLEQFEAQVEKEVDF
jgi:hypothetical protein